MNTQLAQEIIDLKEMVQDGYIKYVKDGEMVKSFRYLLLSESVNSLLRHMELAPKLAGRELPDIVVKDTYDRIMDNLRTAGK